MVLSPIQSLGFCGIRTSKFNWENLKSSETTKLSNALKNLRTDFGLIRENGEGQVPRTLETQDKTHFAHDSGSVGHQKSIHSGLEKPIQTSEFGPTDHSQGPIRFYHFWTFQGLGDVSGLPQNGSTPQNPRKTLFRFSVRS